MEADDYVEHFRSQDIVEHYVGVYAPGTFDAHVNDLQATWLQRFARRQFAGTPFDHLDFACGTGRILKALSGVAASSAGYDTSAAMIAVAEKEIPGVDWHVVAPDATGWDIAPPVRPRLVTAFRFLLNADPEFQGRAFEFATEALPSRDSGVLVVNNHGHSRSALRFGSKETDETGIPNRRLSDAAVLKLADAHGYELQQRAAFALMTRRLYRSRALAAPARLVNRLTAGSKPLATVASDVVYVFRRR